MRRVWLVGLGLLLVIGATGWYYLVGTPQYSIYRLSVAFQERDIEEVERYIDIDRVSDEAFAAVEAIQAKRQAASGSEGLGTAFADGLIELLKPMLKTRLKDELRMQLRKATEEGG